MATSSGSQSDSARPQKLAPSETKTANTTGTRGRTSILADAHAYPRHIQDRIHRACYAACPSGCTGLLTCSAWVEGYVVLGTRAASASRAIATSARVALSVAPSPAKVDRNHVDV